MPYIKKARREAITMRQTAENPGELNYAITILILDYIYSRQNKGLPIKYQDINDVLGALEGAKLEFYRRFAAEYEDDKIKENGDVYK